jgi:hypothetical protein
MHGAFLMTRGLMTRSGLTRFYLLAAMLISASACSGGKPFVPEGGGPDGSAGSGGRGGTGGTRSTGGTGGATGGSAGQTAGTGGHAGGAAGSGAGGAAGVGAGGASGSVGTAGSGGGATGGSTSTGGSGATGGAVAGTSGTAGAGGRGGGGAGGSQTAGTGGSSSTGGTTGTGGTGGTTPPCTGATKHMCPSGCVDNSSVMSCGSRCDACPVPAGGSATCDGTTCGFTCGGSTPKQCLTAGICIAANGCCSNTDCPTNAGGQTGSCDTGTHMCNYTCTGSTPKACTSGSTTVCIASGGCCSNSDCTGTCMMCNTTSHTCTAVKGMDDPNGRCTGTCDSSGACKAKQGQSCTTGTDCITTYCADRICCNSACTGACEYCNGSTPGTCGYVSGAPKTGHPACSGSGSCAGFCDGTKATCKMPGSETSCRSMSCSGGTMTNPAVCDGSGNCPALSTTGCGAYTCNGTSSCYTSCSSPAQCAANSICSGGGQCSMCGSGKAVCSNGCYDINNDAGHCGTSCRVCAGSTPSCASGNCVCRIKSAGNILTNPGFNTSISSWSTSGNTTWSTNDVEGCAGSGSLQFVSLFDSVVQCVTAGIQPSMGFGFGFFYKGTNGTGDNSDYVYCETSFYTATDCLNGYMGRASTMVPSDGTSWVPGFISGNVPAGIASIGIHCSGAAGTGYLDQFYFSFAASPGF